MCNINLVMNKKKVVSLTPSLYMNVASFVSYNGNGDAEGMIGFRNKHVNTYKSTSKLVYRQAYSILMSHQRLATHGNKTKDNAHPFITEDLMVMHNGIFSSLRDSEKSDSWLYSELLQKKYEEKKDLIEAIKSLHSEIDGYYSVLVYLRGKSKIYYYKNESARMNAVQNKDWFIMSTNDTNISYAKRFFKECESVEVRSYHIYDVTDNFKPIGLIPHKEIVQKTIPSYSGNGFYSYGFKKNENKDRVVKSSDDGMFDDVEWSD